MEDEPPEPPTVSTLLVISMLVFGLSWGMYLWIWVSRIFGIILPLQSPTFRNIHLAMAIFSFLLVRYAGREEHRRALMMRGRFQLTGIQSVLVAIMVIAFGIFVAFLIGD
jgi:hypothetical protein